MRGGDNIVVLEHLSADVIWPDKRCRHQWEWPYKRGGL